MSTGGVPARFRAVRGLGAGATAATGGIVAHVSAGGGAPTAAMVLLLAAAMVGLGSWLADRPLDGPTQTALALLAQVPLHLMLPGTGSWQTMLLAHGLAAGLTVLVALRLEDALWQVLDRAVEKVLRALRLPAAALRLPRWVERRSGRLAGRPRGRQVAALRTRGPPLRPAFALR